MAAVRPRARPWLWIGVPAGVALGLGLFTLAYAKGLSYASDAPEACANCHIMREQYDGWLAGSHHAAAVCNDCHVPHDFVGKWLAKGLNGFHHSTAFTLQNFHEPIRITPRNASALEANCLRCHGAFVSEIERGHRGESTNCVHCHRGVGHAATE
jgi:cytochrome c nitrite reductase small subunit